MLIVNQIAIAKFFDGEQPDPVAEARASMSSPPPATSSRRTQNLQYENHAPGRTTRNRPVGDTVSNIDLQSPNAQPTYQAPLLLSLLFTPFNILYRVVTTILSPIGTLFPFLPRLLSRFYPSSGSVPRSLNTSGRRTLPPRDNAIRFIRELGEEYGEQAQSLPFVEAGFNLTLDNAKSSLKYLLVILLSPEHDDTPLWVRNTLLSTQFSNFLRDKKDEIILWGGNVQDSEAYQVADQLRCTKFPFAALVVHTPEVSSTAMSVVARVAGPTTASELVAKLVTAITNNNESLSRVRAQRTEQQASRNLRQEQDSAYERSLAQDRERARRRKEEEAARAAAEKEALAKAEAAEKRKRDEQQWRIWRAQSLPLEPQGAAASDIIRVSIRLPSGERVIRKFLADADLEEVYAFVECYDVLNDVSKEGPEAIEEPEGFDHKYNFRLVSPMPRTVFELGDGGSVGERIGKGGGNLIVEPIDEEDDEELEEMNEKVGGE